MRWGIPSALLVFASWFAGAVFGSLVSVVIWGTGATSNAWAIALVFVTQGIGAIAALTWVTMVRGQRSFAKDFGLRAYLVDLVWLPAGVGLQILGNLVMLPVVQLLGKDDAPQEVARTIQAAPVTAQIVLVLCVGFAAPVIEELMFHGLLMRALQRQVAAPWAVLISALVFAGLHLLDGGAWIVLPTLFAVGILAGFLATRTGRLGPSIAMHAGFNLLALVAILLT